ncbi:exonuclease domain-containing protein [Streptomyces sp. MB09-01]|uniref:exonuclease domain-containing protein n=1 Tax=Streptomyces sp. MB09-01 TaxID=3028666 RepID=UPI0029AE6AB2|nr:exonuclease domain-containing protein [Streptomyces sp. MB09-01]MDX3535813.1 exonuclease domain-containing protein [Streptomyces sp. MB09-01]
MSWISGPMVAFDLETTGTDIESDRIVTAAVVAMEPDGRVARTRTWLVDPGVAIPEQAAAIHGISTEHARTEGVPAAPAIAEITQTLADGLGSGTPLVVMNARYDLSLLDRECRRHGIAPLADRLRGRPAHVIDPLVLDKHADRYRKGRRTLQALCEHYGVTLDDAHNAAADALAAARAARRVGAKHASIGSIELADLHDLQIRAAAQQAQSLQSYLRRTSDPEAIVEPAWPVVPRRES